VDPEDFTLTVINATQQAPAGGGIWITPRQKKAQSHCPWQVQCYYISLLHPVTGADGKQLEVDPTNPTTT